MGERKSGRREHRSAQSASREVPAREEVGRSRNDGGNPHDYMGRLPPNSQARAGWLGCLGNETAAAPWASTGGKPPPFTNRRVGPIGILGRSIRKA
jgi:hypothetical protein